ncbi:MAG: hypothetical protein Q9219_007263 [cf. Caloplaca sp. 3 TL-2023]
MFMTQARSYGIFDSTFWQRKPNPVHRLTMSLDSVTRARIILETVHLTSIPELPTLHQLIAREPETLQPELVLRIILTFLPESTEPNLYTELIRQLARGAVYAPQQSTIRPIQPSQPISDDEARRQVRQLHLLPLAQEQDLHAGCSDILSLFLIHRCRRVDVETGNLSQIQELLEPFLDRDPYLRDWMISTVLPLRRLDYEYYPQPEDTYTIATLEKLDGRPAIDSLLARSLTTKPVQSARDIRGLVGPWIHGESRRKRRKTHHDRRRDSLRQSQSLDQASVQKDAPRSGWSDVNDWLVELAIRDFSSAAETLKLWNGPVDVDYGSYHDNEEVDDGSRRLLQEGYAQAGLAAIYTNTDTSIAAIEDCQTILSKVAQLSNLEPPILDRPQGAILPRVSTDYVNQLSEVHLFHNALLKHDNSMTSPGRTSLSFASLILRSSAILQRLCHPRDCKSLVRLAVFARGEEQIQELHKTIQQVPVKTRDEGSWAKVRHQILWLRDWQYNELEGSSYGEARSLGVFGKLKRLDVEVELLRALLRASCYNLAVRIYCTQVDRPLPNDILEKTVLSVAMSFYDGASNGNRTRGGVRKASEIIASFQGHFPDSAPFDEANALVAATHAMSFYCLTLQHGVPFQPVNIRVSKDPMSLIGKILEQNPRSYTKIDDLIDIGQNLVKARLGPSNTNGTAKKTVKVTPPHDKDGEMADASNRITSMAIEASLAEGDFDSAYSYIVNRLSPSSLHQQEPDQTLPSDHDDNDDDISWRAAYLAGRSSSSSSSSPSLHRLSQRLELLSLAALLAPSTYLREILLVWRTVETDLLALSARESAEEERWDRKGDRAAGTVPGGFAPMSAAESDRAANQQLPRRNTAVAAANEEAPMGLFDVARGAARAFRKTAFPLHGSPSTITTTTPPPAVVTSETAASETVKDVRRPLSPDPSGGAEGRVRKRDLVASAVTGGLASGIGWVIGAPAAPSSSSSSTAGAGAGAGAGG